MTNPLVLTGTKNPVSPLPAASSPTTLFPWVKLEKICHPERLPAVLNLLAGIRPLLADESKGVIACASKEQAGITMPLFSTTNPDAL